MENIEAFYAELGCFVDYGFNRHFCGFEMPIGISGDAELDALFVRGRGRFLFIFLSAEGERGAETSCAGEK